MVHAISPSGIVGMGALGRGIESTITSAAFASPPAVLFTVKAFDLKQALLEQADNWDPEIPFIILSNGFIWPVVDDVKFKLKKRPLRIGMTTIGSTIKPNGAVEVFSANTITAWGNWGIQDSSPTKQELELLHLFPRGQWFDDIRPMIRQKWLLNVVINTLTGVHHLQSNSLLVHHRKEAEQILAEAYKLAAILWKDLPWDISAEEMKSKLWALVQATAGNENSMAKDIRMKRRTESDYLAGIALQHEGFPLLKELHQEIILQR